MRTEAIEDYLKAIYEIERNSGKTTTTDLARRLDVTPASVSGMIKKLAGLELVTHRPYRGVVLTEKGFKISMSVLRQHRLLELYLVEQMGLSWDKVHEEADKLEHVLSDYLEERIDFLLGHPATDPHGASIPDREGSMPKPAAMRLAELVAGQSATVAEIEDHDPELLRYIGRKGLLPQTRVKVLSIEPFDGPLTIRVEGSEHTLGKAVAHCIYVTGVRTQS
jgi:DtxR family Mn-dependent transcriptional regulator